jgi:hypothetical protein
VLLGAAYITRYRFVDVGGLGNYLVKAVPRLIDNVVFGYKVVGVIMRDTTCIPVERVVINRGVGDSRDDYPAKASVIGYGIVEHVAVLVGYIASGQESSDQRYL